MILSVRNSVILLLSIIVTLLLLPSSVLADHEPDEVYIPTKYNGVKVYLSPSAHEHGDNWGCDQFSENENSEENAREAAKRLVARGYAVTVGLGDFYYDNADSSNAWGADYHIPIHSNAGAPDCNGYDPARGGTWVMYDAGYTDSYNLAVDIESVMDGSSPGTNDKVLTDVQASDWEYYEFANTYAKDAYIEVGFHTYLHDVNWMLNHSTVGNIIANGIHLGIDANDCRYETCMTLTEEMKQELSEPVNTNLPSLKLEEISFDYVSHGVAFKDLENDLNALINNKASVLSYLSGSTGLNGVSINDDGVVIVDFKHFDKGGPSSYQKSLLYDELYNTLFKYDEVKEVYVQFDGSFTSWVVWLESTPKPMVRK
jgi:hypothetical protein